MKERYEIILKTSIVGIIVNVIVAAIKAFIGIISSSIAITLDAVNNLTDAVSSLITIIGVSLAGKQPNKKHPFGYGRTEYIATMIIGILITYAGVTAAVESIKGIISPEEPEYSMPMLIVIAIAVLVKVALGLYFQKKGKQVSSDSLVATGKEASLDAVVSAATLVAAIIYIVWGLSLEAYLALIISLLIVKSGIEVLIETISKILGEGASVELVKAIKKSIAEHDGVYGAYDLVLNNYGQDIYLASVHIEVEDTMRADEIDLLTRTITDDITNEFGVVLSSIGLYSHNTKNPDILELKEKVSRIALHIEYVHQIHGFYANLDKKEMRFDIVVSFDAKDRNAIRESVIKAISEQIEGYTIKVSVDIDFNEI